MRLLVIVAICAVVTITGCVSAPAPQHFYLEPVQRKIDDIGLKYAEDEVEIDLGEIYLDDKVELYVNGKRAFSRTITTPNNGTGFTDSIKLSTTEQYLELRLFINGVQWKSRLNLKKGRFFCIMMSGDKPRIEQARFSFFYD